MRKLLTEQTTCEWIIESDILDESTKASLPPGVIMQARGKFAHAGRITSNARLYTRAWYESQIARVSRKNGELSTGAMLGETDHPSPTRGGPSVRQLCFIVRGLDMSEAGDVMGRINVVGTGAGEDYAAGIRAGAQIGFSSRARGDTTPKKMSDQHPDWDLNQDWNGKDFEEVNEDAELVTFDAVLGPAISDAHVADYNEQNNPEEEDMIKLAEVLKNEELMKGILESDAVKALVATAVTEAEKKAGEEFDKNLPEMITKFMESDTFVAKMREKLEIADKKEGEGDEAELEEAKCPECDGPVGKGAKYCPGCGNKMTVAAPPPAESKEEADKANAELLKRVEALEKSNKELTTSNEAHTKKDKDAVAKEAVEDQVDALLENCGELLNTRVRARLEDQKDLTEDTAEDTVKRLVEQETAFIKQMGGEQLLEKGKKSGTNDGDEDEKVEDEKDPSVDLTERLVN